MRPIRITGLDKDITLWTPTSWQEVTVEQYIRIEAEGWDGADLIHLLSMLSGHDLKELDNITDTSLFDVLAIHLNFITKEAPDFKNIPISKTFKLDGKEFDVPSDLELETLGQKILMSNLRQQDNMIKQVANALAIYFQPIYDNSTFDRKRLPYIVKMIHKEPIVDMFPIVDFFFQKLTEYKKNGISF